MIKVLIADDIQILRQGLKAIIEQADDMEVVALASNGEEAFQKACETNPNVVLMDMRMPEHDGEHGTRKIKQELPDTKVLVLTTFDDEETISKAMAGGADGYILKELENEKVLNAIRMTNDGMSVFGSSTICKIQQQYNTSIKAPEFSKENSPLTDREIDIITLIAQGMNNKEIAANLYLAEGTIRNVISRMLEKLEFKDRTQLAVYAIKNNIL